MRVTEISYSAISETAKAVLERRNGNTWRQLSESLGIHFAILHAVGNESVEHVSWENFNRVRAAVGLCQLAEPIIVSPCPDCGHVHTYRCHGVPVKPVGKPRNRTRYHRPCMDDAEYAEYLEWKEHNA
jgi:hypothetical protein